MQLKELLLLPVYRDVRIRAGELGLERQVKSVNMMDAPDIIHYLKPDELLLTTAYAMREQPDQLLLLIGQMAEADCAGLGIKTKRFLKEIPKQALELADALHFPLIELSLEPPLGELLQESLRYIMEKNNEELRYALKMHRDFSTIIMQGKGNESILRILSDLVEGTVLLADGQLQILAQAGKVADSVCRRMLAALPEVAGSLEKTAARSTCFSLFPADGTEPDEVLVYAIELSYQPAFLIVVNRKNSHSPYPDLAVEQATNVIGFELMKQQALKERSRRYKNEFFEDLIEGRFSSSAEIAAMGKRYGIMEGFSYWSIAGKTDESPDRDLRGLLYSSREALYDILKRTFNRHELPCVMFNNKDLFVVLLKWEWQRPFTEKQLADCLRDIQEELYSCNSISFSFGIGNPVDQLTHIPTAFNEALEALQDGYQSLQTRFIHAYRTREAEELLKMIPEGALTDFYLESFRAVLEEEPHERDELMATARVFLDTQGQIGETAKRLFVHRNTVSYRLNKYEQLTRRSLRDSNDSLRFRIAFLIGELLQEGQAPGAGKMKQKDSFRT
ncbi:MAG: PucR family transcriptional regulator [Paenibacillaceae bacterium]|nr:PucR family transcriptional regulator [Paenibacillaceae bacterium]